MGAEVVESWGLRVPRRALANAGIDAGGAERARGACGTGRAARRTGREEPARPRRAGGAPRWFELDSAERLLQARIRRDDWRRAVAQGVVAVLDARTDL